MKVILKARGAGKTTELIKRAHKDRKYIVTFNNEEAVRIFLLAKKMGKPVHFPVTFDEFIKRQYHLPGIMGFHIDNLDICIQSLCGVPIDTVTLSKPTPTEPRGGDDGR